MLICIDKVLNAAEVASFRSRLEQAPWQDGAATAGELARSAKQNLQLQDGVEPAVSLGAQVLRKLAQHPLFISAALPSKIFPPKFNCYRDGGSYGAHVDSALLQISPDQFVRSDVSATLFLAAPDEYDGGELEIEGPMGVQTVKLDAGDMVLYPSTSLHRVTPVTRGARLASFFWIESLVPDESARTLLFDLDQSIQTLRRTRERDDAAVLKLTGVYHNLLRRWART
jgi:PKHD-type hydroxylase